MGIRASIATLLTQASPATIRRIQQLIGHPTLLELQADGILKQSAAELLGLIVGMNGPFMDQVVSEYSQLSNSLGARLEIGAESLSAELGGRVGDGSPSLRSCSGSASTVHFGDWRCGRGVVVLSPFGLTRERARILAQC
jgi:hypothetical protein